MRDSVRGRIGAVCVCVREREREREKERERESLREALQIDDRESII